MNDDEELAESNAKMRSTRETIQATFQAHVNELAGQGESGGGVVTDWVLAVEVMDENGSFWLHGLASENMTQWKRRGILDTVFDD